MWGKDVNCYTRYMQGKHVTSHKTIQKIVAKIRSEIHKRYDLCDSKINISLLKDKETGLYEKWPPMYTLVYVLFVLGEELKQKPLTEKLHTREPSKGDL